MNRRPTEFTTTCEGGHKFSVWLFVSPGETDVQVKITSESPDCRYCQDLRAQVGIFVQDFMESQSYAQGKDSRETQ
jgi:hypothetical protein